MFWCVPNLHEVYDWQFYIETRKQKGKRLPGEMVNSAKKMKTKVSLAGLKNPPPSTLGKNSVIKKENSKNPFSV